MGIKNPKRCFAWDSSGREEEIRTLDTVTRILPFQGSSFNHSDTSLFECAKIVLFSRIPMINSFARRKWPSKKALLTVLDYWDNVPERTLIYSPLLRW